MRGRIPGLDSPHPMGLTLPTLYQRDDFAQRLVAALDEVLAPVFVTLDCLEAYFDAQLTPTDFLQWLAGWVGVALDENWSTAQQRALVADMVQLYGLRGTVRGLRELLATTTGAEVEVADSGGTTWSGVPGGALPGSPEPRLVVRVREGTADLQHVEQLVAQAKPAHVPHVVEEVGT
ncbi:MAG: phage tail protein [Actinomycetota bacterium]|nr:phage tail protein [Actinomycetota bacterium]